MASAYGREHTQANTVANAIARDDQSVARDARTKAADTPRAFVPVDLW